MDAFIMCSNLRKATDNFLHKNKEEELTLLPVFLKFPDRKTLCIHRCSRSLGLVLVFAGTPFARNIEKLC
jgi:hypothetical protein